MGFLRIVVALLVAGIWGAAYGQSIVTGSPTPPAELSGLMLAVVTWLFAGAAREAVGRAPKDDATPLRRKIGRWLLKEGERDEA